MAARLSLYYHKTLKQKFRYVIDSNVSNVRCTMQFNFMHRCNSFSIINRLKITSNKGRGPGWRGLQNSIGYQKKKEFIEKKGIREGKGMQIRVQGDAFYVVQATASDTSCFKNCMLLMHNKVSERHGFDLCTHNSVLLCTCTCSVIFLKIAIYQIRL